MKGEKEIEEEITGVMLYPKHQRDKKMWNLYKDTLEKMYNKGGVIFFRGLMSVIINLWYEKNGNKALQKQKDRIGQYQSENFRLQEINKKLRAELQKQREEIIKEIRKLDIPAYLYSSKTFARECSEKTIITLINKLKEGKE